MALKKSLLNNGLIADVEILDVLRTYNDEAIEVGTIIRELVKVLDSDIIEEYEERVEKGAIKELVRGEKGKRRAVASDANDKVSVMMSKKELMNLFEKVRAIEACSKMNKALFIISQNELIKYLREYEKDTYLEESVFTLKKELESEQEKNKHILSELEEKELKITKLQRLSDGIESEYLDLIKEYNDNSKELKNLKQEIKKLKEKVIEPKEIIKIYEQDKRFEKSHDKYPNNELYKIVIEKVLPYKKQKNYQVKLLFKS